MAGTALFDAFPFVGVKAEQKGKLQGDPSKAEHTVAIVLMRFVLGVFSCFPPIGFAAWMERVKTARSGNR